MNGLAPLFLWDEAFQLQFQRTRFGEAGISREATVDGRERFGVFFPEGVCPGDVVERLRIICPVADALFEECRRFRELLARQMDDAKPLGGEFTRLYSVAA